MTRRRTTEDTLDKMNRMLKPLIDAQMSDLERENQRLCEWQAAVFEATGTNRPDHALSVIQTTAKSLAEREADLQELCEVAGVNHKGNLLQKLKAVMKPAIELPEVFRFHPPHWVREEKTTLKEISFCKWVGRTTPAVTALQAQKKLDRLAPVLFAVLDEVETLADRDQVFAEVVECFKSKPYEEFAELCYDFLRGDLVDEEEDCLPKEEVEAAGETPEEQIEEIRSYAVNSGLEFHEDATRCLLLTQV